MGKDPIWWIPQKTLFIEYNEKDPRDPNNQIIRSLENDSAAQQNNNEDRDDEPVMDPPLSEDEGTLQNEESFMADSHDDFPEGFMN